MDVDFSAVNMTKITLIQMNTTITMTSIQDDISNNSIIVRHQKRTTSFHQYYLQINQNDTIKLTTSLSHLTSIRTILTKVHHHMTEIEMDIHHKTLSIMTETVITNKTVNMSFHSIILQPISSITWIKIVPSLPPFIITYKNLRSQFLMLCDFQTVEAMVLLVKQTKM